jgi:hypothetical protein
MTDVFKQGFFEVQDANSQLLLFLMLNQEWLTPVQVQVGKHCIWQL